VGVVVLSDGNDQAKAAARDTAKPEMMPIEPPTAPMTLGAFAMIAAEIAARVIGIADTLAER
jgi:hypothetical protein